MPNEMLQWIADLVYANTTLTELRERAEQSAQQLINKGAEAVPVLIAALKGEHRLDLGENVAMLFDELTHQIAQVLAVIAGDSAVEPLTELVLKSVYMRAAGAEAIYVLQQIGTPKAANGLIQIMNEKAIANQPHTPRSDKLASVQAASALIAIGSVDEVLKVVDNPAHPAHWQAVLALTESDDNRAIEPLIKILRESSLIYHPYDHLIVANRMIQAFVELHGKNAIEILDEVIQNPKASYHVRRTAEIQKARLNGQIISFMDVDVTKLTNAEVLELANWRMDAARSNHMSTLLDRWHLGELTEDEKIELTHLRGELEQKSLQRSIAIREAQGRHLKWNRKLQKYF